MAKKQPKKMRGEVRSLKRMMRIAWNYELKDRFIPYCNIKKRGCEGGGEKRRQINQNCKLMFNLQGRYLLVTTNSIPSKISSL